MSTTTAQPQTTDTTFEGLGVDEDLADALATEGITEPFPIQQLTIPLGMSGADVIGQARTGTGKTLAFGLPLLQRIKPGRGHVQALVVTPTRELAIQVASDLDRTGKPREVDVLPVYGGVPIGPQTKSLDSGNVDVVVGTPGRLLDHRRRGNLDLSQASVLVLDEADRMLDMGFLPDVEKLINACSGRNQTLLFSATMPSAVVSLARRYMQNPTFIQAEADEPSVPPETEQHFFLVHRLDKPRILARILQAPDVDLATVFVRTKRMADRLVRELDRLGVNATPIHGDLRQERREKNLTKFRRGKAEVLVATEVAARGLDIDKVTHVINYDCPHDEQMYLHRVGRTGRAGAAGVAVTFATHSEVGRLNMIRRAVGKDAEPLPEVFSTSDLLDERFDLPSGTPWDHLRGNGDRSRDQRSGDDASGDDPSRPRKDRHDAADAADRSDETGADGDGAEDDEPVRSRTRTRDETPSRRERATKAADAAPDRVRTRRREAPSPSRSDQRSGTDHASRRGKRAGGNGQQSEPSAAGRAAGTTEPALPQPARGSGRPTLRRPVRVEHLP